MRCVQVRSITRYGGVALTPRSIQNHLHPGTSQSTASINTGNCDRVSGLPCFKATLSGSRAASTYYYRSTDSVLYLLSSRCVATTVRSANARSTLLFGLNGLHLLSHESFLQPGLAPSIAQKLLAQPLHMSSMSDCSRIQTAKSFILRPSSRSKTPRATQGPSSILRKISDCLRIRCFGTKT